MSLRVVITGGGTGGHVYPALAIAEALRELRSDIDIHFVGTANGFEAKAVRIAGEKFSIISAGGLVGKSAFERLRGAWKAAIGVLQSVILLKRLKPNAVIGTGGYVMGPVVWAAQLMRIATFLQEQNSYPGLTTRKLARKAKEVFLGFGQAAQFLPNAHTFESGNPLRARLIEFSTAVKSPEQSPHLLVLGGSQGAQSINKAVADSLEEIAKVARVTWQFGKAGLPQNAILSFIDSLKSEGRLVAEPFFNDMQERYSAASVVLCRAGAMTLAEVALYGLPSVLVPFPHAAHDHQTANAVSFVNSHAAIVIRDHDLNRESLLENVIPLLADHARRDSMSTASKSLARPQAARDIAKRILNSL